MAGKSLEQRVHIESEGGATTTPATDWYKTGSVEPLYTGPVDDEPSLSQPDPIELERGGSVGPDPHTGFSANRGQMRSGLNTGLPEEKTYGQPLLQERYDFSGHHNDDDKPNNLHLNTDIPGMPNNGATALGPAHTKNLQLTDAEVAAAQKEMERMAERCKRAAEDMDKLNGRYG